MLPLTALLPAMLQSPGAFRSRVRLCFNHFCPSGVGLCQQGHRKLSGAQDSQRVEERPSTPPRLCELCFVQPLPEPSEEGDRSLFSRLLNRTSAPPGKSRSTPHVSNYPFPNRTCAFRRIRLSGDTSCSTVGLCSVSTEPDCFYVFSCGPSPCPGRYPRHLSTMAAP